MRGPGNWWSRKEKYNELKSVKKVKDGGGEGVRISMCFFESTIK